MNESNQACCEHYQSAGWMNTLSCKAQLLFSCLTACLSSCLSTCLPDYLPTYRAPFVQIKERWMGAWWNIISFHKNSFWEGDVLHFSLCASKPYCLPPLLTVQPLSITLSDRLSSSLPVCLNIPDTSLALCFPPCPLTPNYLLLLDISITVCLTAIFSTYRSPRKLLPQLSPKNHIHINVIWNSKHVKPSGLCFLSI